MDLPALRKKIICFIIYLFSFHVQAQVIPLEHAHAHNDYKHAHPLNDAMKQGFTSFEADVFLKHGKLIIAHISPFLKRATLESLYLKPLLDSSAMHGNFLYANYYKPVLLLIDIKNDPEKTFEALKPLLEKYNTMLSYYENGELHQKAVTIILTGHKPYDSIIKLNHRNAFIDENLLMISKNIFDKNICPLASTKYSNVLQWRGKGNIPANEKALLIVFIKQAHAQGKKVRLWASPENKKVWNVLLDAGVDLINTDELEKLKIFLIEEKYN